MAYLFIIILIMKWSVIKMNINLVIFDMDGLMFDSENLLFKSWKEAMKKMGHEPSMDVFLKTLGITDEKTREFYTDYFGDELEGKRFCKITIEIFSGLLSKGELKIKPGLTELIDYLNRNNIKKAIASSNNRKVIFRNIEVTGIKNDFDYIISGDDVKEGKPHPEIFERVCEALNIAKENTLILEDSLNGIKAGHAASIKSIMIPDLLMPTEEAKEKSHTILNSLFEVIDFLEKSNNGARR
ncbi:MAG TPA: hypothetical protein DCM73_12250 [Clostridiales bacterium]|nr:hypothetical protein [Clostridiales bacterium]